MTEEKKEKLTPTYFVAVVYDDLQEGSTEDRIRMFSSWSAATEWVITWGIKLGNGEQHAYAWSVFITQPDSVLKLVENCDGKLLPKRIPPYHKVHHELAYVALGGVSQIWIRSMVPQSDTGTMESDLQTFLKCEVEIQLDDEFERIDISKWMTGDSSDGIAKKAIDRLREKHVRRF